MREMPMTCKQCWAKWKLRGRTGWTGSSFTQERNDVTTSRVHPILRWRCIFPECQKMHDCQITVHPPPLANERRSVQSIPPHSHYIRHMMSSARLLLKLETQTAERDMMDTFEKSLPTPPILPPLKAEGGWTTSLAATTSPPHLIIRAPLADLAWNMTRPLTPSDPGRTAEPAYSRSLLIREALLICVTACVRVLASLHPALAQSVPHQHQITTKMSLLPWAEQKGLTSNRAPETRQVVWASARFRY